MRTIVIVICLLLPNLLYAQSPCNNYRECLTGMLKSTSDSLLKTSDSLFLKFEFADWDFSKESLNDENLSMKIIFFNLFPDNFSDFNEFYGWDELLDSPQVLYDVSFEHISLFCRIYQIIPKDKYYKKVIDIGINGHWDADAITYFQHCTRDLFLSYTSEFLNTLSEYNESDIQNFWHFFYDALYYDHPMQVSLYKNMHEKIKTLNNLRILELMEKQYKYDYDQYMLMKEEENKGY